MYKFKINCSLKNINLITARIRLLITPGLNEKTLIYSTVKAPIDTMLKIIMENCGLNQNYLIFSNYKTQYFTFFPGSYWNVYTKFFNGEKIV